MTCRSMSKTIAIAIFGAVILSGCGNSGTDQVTLLFAEPKDDGPSSFETHSMLATDMGLVTFDPTGLVRPGLAERWVISGDGLSYIFRLGDHQWQNGDPVTAREISELLKARLKSLGDSQLADQLGAISDIIARTDQIIEIKLDAPRPRMLDMLASPQMTLRRNGEGLGPMDVVESLDNLRVFYPLARNDDATGLKMQHIVTHRYPAAEAIAAYTAGMGNVLLGLNYADLPLIDAAAIDESQIIKDPALGYFGLEIGGDNPLLQSQGLREALAMALDRPKLLSAFGIREWREMTSLAPTQLTNRVDVAPLFWEGLSVAERKELARRRIAGAGLSGRPLSLFIEDKGPGSDLLFGLLAREFDDVGVNLQRIEAPRQADLRLVDAVAEFDDPLWYLLRLTCRRQSVCDSETDLLLEEALTTLSLERRHILAGEAEERLARLYNFIPIAEPLRFSLAVRPMLGLEANLRAVHPLQFLAAEPNR